MKLFKKLLYPALAFVGILSFTVVASVGSFLFNSSINKSHYTIVDNGSTAEEVIENELKSEGKDPSTAGTITEGQTSAKELKWAVTLGTGESASYVTIKGVISSGEFTLRIPSSIRGKAVTTISSMAFAGNTKLKKLVLPASITKVKTGALSGCTALEAVEVDSANTTYTAIDGNLCTKADGALVAFAGGKTLTGGKYTLSAGLPMIKAGAFNGSTVTALAGDADAIMTYYFNADFSDTAKSGDISSSDFNKNIYLKWQLKQPTVTANTSAKTISWAVVPYATSYLVQKGTSASSLTDYTTTTATSLDLSSLAVGTYYFAVTAKADGYTSSAASSAVSYVAEAAKITITFVFKDLGGYGCENNGYQGFSGVRANGASLTNNQIKVEAGLTWKQIVTKLNLQLYYHNCRNYWTNSSQHWVSASATSISYATDLSGQTDSLTKYYNGLNMDAVINTNTTITLTYDSWTCLTADTEILVYDEKKKKYVTKKIKDITYNDLVACWDFDNGKLTYAKPVWISKSYKTEKVTRVTYSDGTVLDVCGNHSLFSVEDGAFVHEVSKYKLGTTNYKANGEFVTITKIETINKTVQTNSIITNYHMNCFANGVLTSVPYNNLYPIKDMKFVKDDRKLRKFEEYDVPREFYDGFRLGEVQYRSIDTINKSIKDTFIKPMLPKE